MWVPQILKYWNRQEHHPWIKILQWATEKVVPINNILFTTPTVTIWSDAYKYGIGVYNDKAWNGSGTYPEMA